MSAGDSSEGGWVCSEFLHEEISFNLPLSLGDVCTTSCCSLLGPFLLLRTSFPCWLMDSIGRVLGSLRLFAGNCRTEEQPGKEEEGSYDHSTMESHSTTNGRRRREGGGGGGNSIFSDNRTVE